MRMARSASGGAGGAAVPASPAKAVPRATTTTFLAWPRTRLVSGAVADEGESDEDEFEEQPGVARSDQAANGERRPRRRGRRGGRRRRGGPEDGLAGSIADELGPTSAPEAASAVADFDGIRMHPSSHRCRWCNPNQSHRAGAATPDRAQPEPARASAAWTAAERKRPLRRPNGPRRRRSTVREKVSFLVDAQPDAAPAVQHSQPEPTATPAPAEPAPAAAETTDETQPRRAGWWSRRFGSGE